EQCRRARRRRGERRRPGRSRERRRTEGRRGAPRAHAARAGGRLGPRRKARRGHRRLGHVREDLPRPGARQAPDGRGTEAAQGRWQLMSSHREAPEISKDPVADNTDVYAFVSPDNPSTVTFITNFVPLQDTPGGPNFFEFGDDVAYWIYVDNDKDGKPEIGYLFMFNTTVANPDTFLYNTGPITSLDSPNWNRRQFYSVWRVDGDDVTTYQP